jgi:hypothetical protein
MMFNWFLWLIFGYGPYICPECGCSYNTYRKFPVCPYCGEEL